jgi:hypothetical protein
MAFGTVGTDATNGVPHPDRSRIANVVAIKRIDFSLVPSAAHLIAKTTCYVMLLPIPTKINLRLPLHRQTCKTAHLCTVIDPAIIFTP